MPRVLSPVLIGILAFGVAVTDAQVHPNFSGNWALLSSSPDGTAALGADFMISQDAETIQFHRIGYVIGGVSPGPGVTERRYPVKFTYVLDGVEHPTNLISEPPLPSPLPSPRAGVMTSRSEESISKATWAAAELVIMQYNKQRTIAPGRTPADFITRQTVRQALSLDANGTLVVESLIVADPSPWGHKSASPIPVRSVYKKTDSKDRVRN